MISLIVPGLGQLLQRRVESALTHLYVAVLLWVVFVAVLIAGHDPLRGALFPLLFHVWSAVDEGMWRVRVSCRTK